MIKPRLNEMSYLHSTGSFVDNSPFILPSGLLPFVNNDSRWVDTKIAHYLQK